MPSRSRHPIRIALASLLLLATAAAWAQGGRGQQERGNADRPQIRGDAPAAPASQSRQRPQRDDSLADSVRRVERSTRGQVLSAERMQSDGRDVNRIKVMDDRGRVRVYMDDPQQRRNGPTRDDDN